MIDSGAFDVKAERRFPPLDILFPADAIHPCPSYMLVIRGLAD